jgi:hypothetical protein
VKAAGSSCRIIVALRQDVEPRWLAVEILVPPRAFAAGERNGKKRLAHRPGIQKQVSNETPALKSGRWKARLPRAA